MHVSNDLPERLDRWQTAVRAFLRSIRTRIVLPYAVLTLVVAIAGTFIVTTLVQGSLEERLRTQLADAAGVASDRVALFENELLEQLRSLTFLQGAYETMRDGDYGALQDLMTPNIVNYGIQRTVITDQSGTVILDIRLLPGQSDPLLNGPLVGNNLSTIPLVRRALDGESDRYGERHAGLIEVGDKPYLAIAGPFRLTSNLDEPGSEVLGVVMVAEPLESLLDQIKETAVVRRVTVYDSDGSVVATTLGAGEPSLQDLAISPSFFQAILADPDRTLQDERMVLGRRVRFAYFVFIMRHRALGAMSIGLESGFVADQGTLSRLQLSIIFGGTVVAVILIGYGVSRGIIYTIMQLVRTSRAVSAGDLSQRTGITSDDELGKLATTFDQMTESLAQRTAELERLLREKREEASRVNAILSSISEGVLVENHEKQIIPMNPAAYTLLNLLSEQFNDMQPVREIDSSGSARRFEIGNRVISSETSPVRLPDGEQLGSVIVMRDITQETEADRLKDEFVTQISHELRTPLTSILGYSNLLLRMGGAEGNEEGRFLETINRQATTLVEMITQLIDFTQLEAGNLGLRLAPMSMENVVQQVVETWQERFEEKGVQLVARVQDSIPEMVGDASRLRSALNHLVDNAYKYTPEGGEVTIALGVEKESIKVKVIDTGVGIDAKDQAHLFTRFYRVDIERTVDVRGAGVGLYVTKAIIEQHGGEIWVESELGQGSTFAFTLPLDGGARDPKATELSLTDLGDLLR